MRKKDCNTHQLFFWCPMGVKDVRAFFLYSNRPVFKTTWTGDTHGETNILPSSKWNEESQC